MKSEPCKKKKPVDEWAPPRGCVVNPLFHGFTSPYISMEMPKHSEVRYLTRTIIQQTSSKEKKRKPKMRSRLKVTENTKKGIMNHVIHLPFPESIPVNRFQSRLI